MLFFQILKSSIIKKYTQYFRIATTCENREDKCSNYPNQKNPYYIQKTKDHADKNELVKFSNLLLVQKEKNYFQFTAYTLKEDSQQSQHDRSVNQNLMCKPLRYARKVELSEKNVKSIFLMHLNTVYLI